MKVPRRIFFFLAVNILVVVTISAVIHAFGINPYLVRNGLNWRVLALFCLIWGFAGSLISLFLSKFLVKRAMKVKMISPETLDGSEREILDLVHNQCRKAGMSKMPEVGIYPAEELNAFATGASARNSLVAFSTGILAKMNRRELEGVVSHEVSHIVNGDMITMTLIQGVVNAFVLFLSRVIAFTVSQFVDDRYSRLIYFVLSLIFDIVFSILGSIAVFYFSRIREYRADAGSARLSGRDSMIAALRKLQEHSTSTKSVARGDAYATFKISSKEGFLKLFSSHPPLEKRIQMLQESVF